MRNGCIRTYTCSCRRDSRLELSIPGLAFPLVPHTCVSVLGYHWFRWWLVACSAPSHCLNQCCLFVNRTLGNKFQWNSNLNAIHSIQNMHSIMLSILAAFLSGPLCVKAAPHDRTSYFIRCRTLNSEAHVSLFYYGCEHTRDWYGSLQGRFPHNGLFILLLCIYYDLCLAPCTFTVNKLLLLLLEPVRQPWLPQPMLPHVTHGYMGAVGLWLNENWPFYVKMANSFT